MSVNPRLDVTFLLNVLFYLGASLDRTLVALKELPQSLSAISFECPTW